MSYAKIALLTADEERDLARRRDAGDRSALDELVRRNLALVHHVARRYYRPRRSMDWSDLVQSGYVGLVRASRLWEASRSRFGTFAYCCIKTDIRNAIRNQDALIRIPAYLQESRSKWRDGGPIPGFGGKVRADQLASLRPVRCGVERFANRLSAPTEAEDQDHVGRSLAPLLARLTDRQARVIRLRFGLDGGEPMTFDAIGDELQVSGEAVRQMEGRAMKLLRAKADPATTEAIAS